MISRPRSVCTGQAGGHVTREATMRPFHEVILDAVVEERTRT
ncbi:MAG: hypothetical protein AVDCRST_MAG70-2524 [uncultured Thermomicrobiales bacterium]|uniref:Uncharacterized protein n=1 Tax=uncultured Thermomicrobiales bacterium TaxID=1645740 RepID=A0A6J4V800_9BACT|nr:MAG: hypothetical protein AVDCRST_MAG70-2524 [uncultured Thermomicrobiales bacterium]